MKRIIVMMVSVGIGVGLLQYNPAMQWITNMLARDKMDQYSLQAEQLSSEKIQQLLAEADDYNTRLAKGWIQKSDEYTDAEYVTALEVPGLDTIGLLRIPAIDVNLPIYRGTSDAVLSKGVGHLYGSSLPVGGKGTHAVLSAHSGQENAKYFTQLGELEIGDTFQVEVLDRKLDYQVDDIQIVVPEDINNIKIDLDSDYVTLLTCWPVHVNSHRMLVRGHRMPTLATTGNADNKVSFWEFPGVPWWAFIWTGSVSVSGMVGKVANRRNRLTDEVDEPQELFAGQPAVLPYQLALIENQPRVPATWPTTRTSAAPAPRPPAYAAPAYPDAGELLDLQELIDLVSAPLPIPSRRALRTGGAQA